MFIKYNYRLVFFIIADSNAMYCMVFSNKHSGVIYIWNKSISVGPVDIDVSSLVYSISC